MGVWLLNFTPVRTRQNQGFKFFLNNQSGVKTIEYFHCTCMITSTTTPFSAKNTNKHTTTPQPATTASHYIPFYTLCTIAGVVQVCISRHHHAQIWRTLAPTINSLRL